jgi:predicted ATPase
LIEPTTDGAGFQFVHALVRDALYLGISPPRRRIAHRKIGEAIIAAPNPDLEAAALHLSRAGDSRAATWIVRAGERAERASALLTAVERFGDALRLMDGYGNEPAARAWILLRLGIHYRLDNSPRAKNYVAEAARLADELGLPSLTARVALARGIVGYYAGAIARSLDDLRAGL